MRLAQAVAAIAPLALAACGGGDDPKPAASGGWQDVAGMICADGSPTGIGVSPGSADAVLVYLAGGGACWSATECNAFRGPFGALEFDLGSRFGVGGTILDRALPGNPFATWTIVFVPYCTGDVHVGDKVQTYSTVGWNHHGFRNLQAAVGRIVTEVPRPAQLVVAGSSAGGFGSLVAHDLLRTEWPEPVAAMVDDSGPTFVGTAMPAAVRDAWWSEWNLGSTVTPLCAQCATDLSAIWPELRSRHPADRLALVSTTQDLTMRGFFGDPNGDFIGPNFEADLERLAAKIDLIPNDSAVFRVGDPLVREEHALLFDPPTPVSSYTAGGTTLLVWLSDMAAGRAWTSKGP